MKKVIRETDEKRGIQQITVADERWYMKPGHDAVSAIPTYIPVPSVTWIAGYWPKGIGFYRWLAEKGWDEAEAVKSAAGDKGSAVHLAIEHILSGEEFRIDTRIQDKNKSTEQDAAFRELTYEELLGVKSFLDWRSDMEQHYTLETISNEMTVFSEIHGYAGTVDWIVRITPKATGKNPLELSGPTPYIIDFKTSKQVWKEYELQVSAYREALANGENPIHEKNQNGTERDDLVDFSGLRVAILQLGYERNKAGYKFTPIEDAFSLFLIAKEIWRNEIGENTPGFTKRDFPIVLSPGKEPQEVEVSVEEAMAQPEPAQPIAEQVEEALPIPVKKKGIKR